MAQFTVILWWEFFIFESFWLWFICVCVFFIFQQMDFHWRQWNTFSITPSVYYYRLRELRIFFSLSRWKWNHRVFHLAFNFVGVFDIKGCTFHLSVSFLYKLLSSVWRNKWITVIPIPWEKNMEEAASQTHIFPFNLLRCRKMNNCWGSGSELAHSTGYISWPVLPRIDRAPILLCFFYGSEQSTEVCLPFFYGTFKKSWCAIIARNW